MKNVLLIVAVANYLSFLWTVIGVFQNHSEKLNLNYRLLQLNTIALWIAGPILIWQSEAHSGFPAIIAAQIFCLAAFWFTTGIAKRNKFTAVYSKDKPVVLVKNGPYKYVRHPFYVIYLLCYVSLVFVEFSPAYAALVLSMILIYINAARTEESKFLTSELGEDYRAYKAETGMFLPKFKKAKP